MSVDLARWWLTPAVQTAETWAAVNERVLAEMVAVVARGLEGRVVETEVGGRPLRAVLEKLRLDHPGARLALRDVDWGGWPFVTVAARARALRVERRPPPRVTAFDVEVVGTSALAPLVAWLDGLVTGWSLRVGPTGHVEARRGLVSAVVEPVVADHELRLELRGIRLGRVATRLPRRLRPRRRAALPVFDRGLSVLDARRRGDSVDFRLVLPCVRLPG
jgi:hypothetical protein